MKTLVISSCTGSKKYKHDNQLTQVDFLDQNILISKELILKDFSCSAREMYTGWQHKYLIKAIEKLRKNSNEYEIDLYIVSAGYGLISEDKIISPYNVTFNGMGANKIKEWSNYLGINKDLKSIINEYDLVVVLLGKDYLRALDLKQLEINTKVAIFTPKSNEKLIPIQSNIYI